MYIFYNIILVVFSIFTIFVHMSADITFDETSYPFLLESMQNGFVQYDIWNNIVNSRMYNCGQINF